MFRVRPVTRCTSSIPGHGEPVISVQFSPNGRFLLEMFAAQKICNKTTNRSCIERNVLTIANSIFLEFSENLQVVQAIPPCVSGI